MTSDMHERLQRVVRSTGEAMESDVEAAVGRRRDWHLNVTDFGKSLQSDWNDAVTALQDELRKTLEIRLTSLAEEVESTIEDTDAEWSNVSLDQFMLRDLSGFDAVWGNRLIRAGVGVGGSVLGFSGGAWLGAQIGGALGLGWWTRCDRHRRRWLRRRWHRWAGCGADQESRRPHLPGQGRCPAQAAG